MIVLLPALVFGAPCGAQDLTVRGIEVTQAIQQYDLADPGNPANNSLPLVHRNMTVARVYVDVTGGQPIANVSGRLSVYMAGQLQTVLDPD